MLSRLKFFACLFALFIFFTSSVQTQEQAKEDFVSLINMNMLILPGTQGYLERAIKEAQEEGAKALIVKLDTPGGMLNTTQEMIQAIFQSEVPVFIYVGPTGATATSAGVFITLAGHVAAMMPGTSMGAAHPVAGDGKDIEGDMRAKAENMTIAMVKSITEERGRNLKWAEKAVKESDSITEKEALKLNVVDYIAKDIPDLLKQASGKEIKLNGKKVKLGDYSNLPVRELDISFQNKMLNVLAHPNVAALLWLGATTGLTLELYNPGAIIPGVVGIICLILAITVSQILPITQGGIVLLVLGAILIGAEMYVASGVLGIGGIIAMIFGAMYLIDPIEAPGIAVNLKMFIPVALAVGFFMLWVAREVFKSARDKPTTGRQGLIGMTAIATKDFSEEATVLLNGEIWKAKLVEGDKSTVKHDDELEVVDVKGLVVKVKKPE